MIRAGLLVALLGLAAPALADDAGNARIVSLGGSVSEVIAALGAADRIVARDSTTTWPPDLTALPDVGYVRALSPEGILSFEPGLVLAEEGAGPPQTIEVLRAAGIPFHTIPGTPSPQGVVDKIRAVAAILDRPAEGEALAASVTSGFEQASVLSDGVANPRRVLFVLSLQGGRVMAGGTQTEAAEIIRLAGGTNAVSDFSGYKPMTDEAVLAAAPDVILMMDREGDLSVDRADVLAHPALRATPAGQTGSILRMDGMLLLGFGPRTPDAAKALHAALYDNGAGG